MSEFPISYQCFHMDWEQERSSLLLCVPKEGERGEQRPVCRLFALVLTLCSLRRRRRRRRRRCRRRCCRRRRRRALARSLSLSRRLACLLPCLISKIAVAASKSSHAEDFFSLQQ
jgi:hypothetical protein